MRMHEAQGWSDLRWLIATAYLVAFVCPAGLLAVLIESYLRRAQTRFKPGIIIFFASLGPLACSLVGVVCLIVHPKTENIWASMVIEFGLGIAAWILVRAMCFGWEKHHA